MWQDRQAAMENLYQEGLSLRSQVAALNEAKKWRRRRDSNPRKAFTFAGFQDRCIQPLCHPSARSAS